jgi:hypothetical protein
MSLSVDQIEKTIEQIERLVDPSSSGYGRLLNWQNPPDLFWHYGIGLSNTHIFDTGRALCPVERKEAKFVTGIEEIAFEPKPTIERLKQALHVFATWKYNNTGWNSEHLARLIVTDQPRCYQSISIWMLCDLSPEGDHKTAHKVFRDYLQKVNPAITR